MNLDHRGACGCEANTGDGAGILMQMPHKFLAKVARRRASSCRSPDSTASAWFSARRIRRSARKASERFEKIVAEEGQTVLGWRDVPTDNSSLGKTAQASEPFMRQVFIGRGANCRRRAGVRAQALRDPQARAATRSATPAWTAHLVCAEPVVPHARSTKAC